MSDPRRMYEREGADVQCLPARIIEAGLTDNPPDCLYLKIIIPGGSFRIAVERGAAIQFYKALHLVAEKCPDFFQE